MTYVIGEIGQNHNGSVDLAKELVRMASDPRPHSLPDAKRYSVDAVKLTMRDLSQECTVEFMHRPYKSPHSYGLTYGKHREALELSFDEHHECAGYAHDLGLDFIETLCHPSLIQPVLDRFTPDALKVASRDLTNEPLIEALGQTGLPIILSTGMASLVDIERAISTVGHDDILILHCLSSYPANFSNLNLARIARLQKVFGFHVGYSDHSVGIVAPVCAVAMGAVAVEKHITLDRTAKGSDHAGSLERDGLWRMLRDIRHAEVAIGTPRIECHVAAKTARAKLERYCVAARDLKAGETVGPSDVQLLSTGDGGVLYRDAVGKRLCENVQRGAHLQSTHLSQTGVGCVESL